MLTVQVDDVVWTAGPRVLPDGSEHPPPALAAGQVLQVLGSEEHALSLNTPYTLFLAYLFTIPQPSQWRVSLALDGSSHEPVEGTLGLIVDDIEDLVAGEDAGSPRRVDLLVEYTETAVQHLNERNRAVAAGEPDPGLVPSPDASQQAQQRLQNWLSLPPHERPLGASPADPPPGAAEALGTAWEERSALFRYDPDDAGRFGLVNDFGYSVPTELPSDDGAVLIPFVHAAGGSVAVVRWHERAGGGFETLAEVDGSEDLTLVNESAAPGALVVDLRGPGVTLDVVPRHEFDELVLQVRP